jgi:hypothetical protein
MHISSAAPEIEIFLNLTNKRESETFLNKFYIFGSRIRRAMFALSVCEAD